MDVGLKVGGIDSMAAEDVQEATSSAGPREVVFLHGAALGAEAEAVVLHFEEGDGVALPREGFVEDEDAGLHAGVGIERARREGDDGDEGVSTRSLRSSL